MGKKNKEKRAPIFNMVDIVYPVYGQYPAFETSLRTLPDALQDVSYKVYVTDDCSPDYEAAGKEFYKTHSFASAKVFKQNSGYARAVNSAAQEGTAKYILIMSTDVFLKAGSVKIMVEHLAANPDIGIISPKLLFPPNSKDGSRPANKIQHAGMVFDVNKRPYHLFAGWPEDHPFVNQVRDVNIVTGACFLIRRSLWHQMKGYSLDYGKGTFEDMDLCIRVRMAGYKIRWLPQAEGYHVANLSVIGAKEEFPLGRNYDIFKAKFGDIIPYDDFLFAGYINA